MVSELGLIKEIPRNVDIRGPSKSFRHVLQRCKGVLLSVYSSYSYPSSSSRHHLVDCSNLGLVPPIDVF